MAMEKCSGCSKENQNKVPIIRVIEKLDELFSHNDLQGAKRLLEYWAREAEFMGDNRGKLEILNEMIGLYRRTNERDKALESVSGALDIIEQEKLQNGVNTGTIYINIATTLKAFGRVEDGMPYYKKAQEIYDNYPTISGYKKAALCNNMASAYAEMGDSKNAEQNYLNAIEILSGDSEFYGEIAVSLVNLAHLYEDMAKPDEKINDTMEKAWEYLNKNEIQRDGNYAFICTKCAPSFEYFGFDDKAEQLERWATEIYERS